MRLKDKEFLLNILDGKRLDFYLEDDMFEIEGHAKKIDEEIIIEVLDAVGHVLQISGQYLKLSHNYNKLYGERIDTGKVFEMEINRVYDLYVDPAAEDFIKMKESGVDQFFKKQTDTLVWHENNRWVIELNKINMYFSGNRYYYNSVEELFDSNKEHMAGDWQAIYFSSEVEA